MITGTVVERNKCNEMFEAANKQRRKSETIEGWRKINCLLFDDWLSTVSFLPGILMRCAV